MGRQERMLERSVFPGLGTMTTFTSFQQRE